MKKVKVLLSLVVITIVLSSCITAAPKPFKLDINVNFSTAETKVAVVDGEGNILASRSFKKGETTWQKSQVLCSQ